MLINRAINETNEFYAGTTFLKNFAWGYREFEEDYFSVGSNHGNVFRESEKVIKIVEACECNYLLAIRKNEDDEYTPVIHIF